MRYRPRIGVFAWPREVAVANRHSAIRLHFGSNMGGVGYSANRRFCFCAGGGDFVRFAESAVSIPVAERRFLRDASPSKSAANRRLRFPPPIGEFDRGRKAADAISSRIGGFENGRAKWRRILGARPGCLVWGGNRMFCSTTRRGGFDPLYEAAVLRGRANRRS